MYPQSINAVRQALLEIGRCAGCSPGSYHPPFSEEYRRLDRADESRIDELVQTLPSAHEKTVYGSGAAATSFIKDRTGDEPFGCLKIGAEKAIYVSGG